ncbi:MAG: DNA gyrase inhibitor YacG [Burkholderiaceae bacterium]|nr:DNA gyrase inhibitor YacG [Burkholderiaceae bacterium]
MPRKPAVSLIPSPPPDTRAPARTVRCPACGGPSLYGPTNRWRPFCSERCKLQDLGAWASERFRVEVRESDGAEVDPAIGNDNTKPRVH